MRFAILALVLAACGDNVGVRWLDAWDRYAHAECAWKHACEPQAFDARYVDVDRCARDFSLDCDESLGAATCDSMYPSDRESILEQCEADFLSLPCDSFFAPDSCGFAFARER